MARSCVLRRSMANWRWRQCVSGANLPHLLSDRPASAPLLARFLSGPSSRTAAVVPRGRGFSSGKTLGTAVLDDENTAVSSRSSAVFSSPRPPLKMPSDSCMDVTTFIFDGKENLGTTPALIDAESGRSLTYAELQHVVCSVELGLVGMGVRQGDVVMLLSRNSIHYPVIFLATTSVGGVLATLSPHCSAGEARKQADATGARFIVVEEEFVEKVADLGIPLVIIERGGQKIKVGSTVVRFSELLESDPTCSSAPETRIFQEDPALVAFTSGSTGPVKAVLLPHRSIMAQILQLSAADDGPVGASRTLCCLPMSNVFGLVVITLQQLYRGGTVVVKAKVESGEELLGLVSAHGITHLYALPNSITNLLKIMTTTSTTTASLSSLQRVVSGGAPLGKDAIEEFSKNVPDASFVNIYGLTEATGAIALNNLKEDQASGSVGTLLSGIEAKVLNGNKEPVGPNVQGELHVRGPNVMKGYGSNPETSSGVDSEGWLSTGDIVSFDEGGRMFVMDRIKEAVSKAQQSSG